jgi:hypothetical protein
LGGGRHAASDRCAIPRPRHETRARAPRRRVRARKSGDYADSILILPGKIPG